MKETTTAIIQLYTEKINCNKRPKKDVSGGKLSCRLSAAGYSQTCRILKITASMRLFPC